MTKRDVKEKIEWIKLWSAKGSLLFDSNLGYWYTKINHYTGKPAFTEVIFFYDNGITNCWVTKNNKDEYGKRLAEQSRKNKEYISKIATALVDDAKKITKFIADHGPKELTKDEFIEFWEIVKDYYLQHIAVKYIVDYLTKDELESHLGLLEKARLFSEPIYRNLENYMESFAEHIASCKAYEKEMIIAMTKEEMDTYFKIGKLPEKTILKARFQESALKFNKKTIEIIQNEGIKQMKENIISSSQNTALKGQVAFKGIVKGVARIVLKPTPDTVFSRGDVLITGMTRPEFLFLVKKASAIVTDSGGILSHVAILARELKKPCIMDTKNATSIFKNGDIIEVNADEGIVKLIKRA